MHHHNISVAHEVPCPRCYLRSQHAYAMCMCAARGSRWLVVSDGWPSKLGACVMSDIVALDCSCPPGSLCTPLPRARFDDKKSSPEESATVCSAPVSRLSAFPSNRCGTRGRRFSNRDSTKDLNLSCTDIIDKHHTGAIIKQVWWFLPHIFL